MHACRTNKDLKCRKENTKYKIIIKQCKKCLTFDDVTKENIKKHNANWLQIPGHPYRILIIEGSGKKKIIIQSNKLLTRY